MRSLNSLNQSKIPAFGFGFPYPRDVPPEAYIDSLIERRIERRERDRMSSIRSKARSFVDQTEETDRIRYARKRTPYWYVTINPKPGITVKQLHNQVVNLLQHPDISDPVWCYEIRTAPDQGLHAHLLFTCNTIDNNFCNRKVKAPFVPNICGHLKAIHCKWVSSDEIGAVRSYIEKTYASKKKTKANKATLDWRTRENIPNILSDDHLLVWEELPTQSLIPLN